MKKLRQSEDRSSPHLHMNGLSDGPAAMEGKAEEPAMTAPTKGSRGKGDVENQAAMALSEDTRDEGDASSHSLPRASLQEQFLAQQREWELRQFELQQQGVHPPTPGQFFGASFQAGDYGSLGGQGLSRFSSTPGGFGGLTPGTTGGFGFAGRTPLTGGSFGQAGPLPTPPSAQGYSASLLQPSLGGYASSLTGMEGGLLRGNDPLQPTPVVARRQGGGLSAEEQRWMMRQRHSQAALVERQRQLASQSGAGASGASGAMGTAPRSERRRLDTVDEEDPEMRRYESRPGLDRSPLAGEQEEGQGGKTGEADGEDSQGLAQRGAPFGPARLPSEAPPDSSAGPLLTEFPFCFDGYAAWVCRHCQHVPPYYRGGNYVWQRPLPPPNPFVDLHLRSCPGLNPESMPPSAAEVRERAREEQLREMQQMGGSYPLQQTMGQALQGVPAPTEVPPAAQDEEGNAPDPPGLTSPQPRLGGGQGATSSGAMDSKGGTAPWSQSQAYPSSYQQYAPHASQMIGQMPSGNVPFHPHNAMGPPGADPSAPSPPPKKRRRAPGKNISPKGRTTDDATYNACVQFLAQKAVENARPIAEGSDAGRSLVESADASLLTDYFYHMMQQLVVCRFSEKDRKTRGGKRESIQVGYGGLQCLHCVDAPGARKFYWSTVDRLANSFAEIPGHVLKCKHTPGDIKDALLALKGRHARQMQALPRGSQKVFFRRMWRRLHDGDGGTASTPERGPRQGSAASERGLDPPPSEIKPTATAAADLLAKGPAEEEAKSSPGGTPLPPKEGRRILLAIPEDKDWLSDTDCLVRSSVEVFGATQRDVEQAAADRKYPIKVGQVGIRCVHCAARDGARGAAVAYPYAISGVYEGVREFQRLHLDQCPSVPVELKEASQRVGTGAASLSSVLRRYYVQAAKALGLFDSEEGGIRAGGTPVPLSAAGFPSPSASSTQGSTPAKKEDAPGDIADRNRDPPETGTKRKASPARDEDEGGGILEPEAKKRRSQPEKSSIKEEEEGPSSSKDDVEGAADAQSAAPTAPAPASETAQLPSADALESAFGPSFSSQPVVPEKEDSSGKTSS
ncbi:hypothetical protein ACHAXT_012595 [Thalassiosira profunda]